MSTHTKTIIAVLGICAGIILGEKCNFGSEIAVISLLIFLIQLVIYFFNRSKVIDQSLVERREEKSGSQVTLVSILFFGALFLGIMRTQFVSESSSFMCEQSCTFKARVITEPTSRDVYQVMEVSPEVFSDNRKTMYNVQIKVPLYPKLHVGDVLTLSGKVTAPKNIYPHNEKHSFEYATYLMTKNIGSEMFYPHIDTVEHDSKKTFVENLISFKEKLSTILDVYIAQPEGSLASGMLLGENGMSQELIQTFRVAGLSHIVVLSGFNIAILISGLFLLFMFVPLFVRVFLVSGIVVMFVLMVGAEASVVRATIMSFIALLALTLGRGYVAHQALLVSFILIVLYTPEALLHDVSLHLSFLATLGIVYMSDGVKKYVERFSLHPFFIKLGYQEIIVTTFCAYIMTLPYLMYTFGTISVYGLAANFFVLPLVPFTMFMAFIVIILSFISTTLSYIVGYVTTLLGSFIIWIAQLVESLPYASVSFSTSMTGVVGIYILLLMGYFFFLRERKNETRVTKNDEILSEVISYE